MAAEAVPMADPVVFSDSRVYLVHGRAEEVLPRLSAWASDKRGDKTVTSGVAGQLENLDKQLASADFSEIGADYAPFSFKVRVSTLAALCEDAARVVPSTDFQPVLKGFKVEVGPEGIRLAATDLDLAVVAAAPAVEAAKTASVVVPARRLLDILSTLDGKVDLEVSVAADRADITAGTASWSLRLPDGSDYPALPDVSLLGMSAVNGTALLAALNLARHAIGRESGRPPLQQAVIAKAEDGNMYLTACDSARYVRVPVEFPFPAAISRGAVVELCRQLDHPGLKVQAAIAQDGQLVFQIGLTVFTTQPPPAKFPDVAKLLLKSAMENNQALEVSRSLLAEAIFRARITADPSTNAIALQLSGNQCEVIGLDKAGNRARQVLPAKWEGPVRTVVVSHRYLSELLEVVRDETAIVQLGADSGKRKSPLLYRDTASGLIAVISQMQGNMLGY